MRIEIKDIQNQINLVSSLEAAVSSGEISIDDDIYLSMSYDLCEKKYIIENWYYNDTKVDKEIQSNIINEEIDFNKTLYALKSKQKYRKLIQYSIKAPAHELIDFLHFTIYKYNMKVLKHS